MADWRPSLWLIRPWFSLVQHTSFYCHSLIIKFDSNPINNCLLRITILQLFLLLLLLCCSLIDYLCSYNFITNSQLQDLKEIKIELQGIYFCSIFHAVLSLHAFLPKTSPNLAKHRQVWSRHLQKWCRYPRHPEVWFSYPQGWSRHLQECTRHPHIWSRHLV